MLSPAAPAGATGVAERDRVGVPLSEALHCGPPPGLARRIVDGHSGTAFAFRAPMPRGDHAWHTEVCDHCLQVYAYEEQYRCQTCDGDVCRDCVVVVRETRACFCPGCPPPARGRRRKEARR